MSAADPTTGVPTRSSQAIGGWLWLIALGLVVSIVSNARNCVELFRFLATAQRINGGVAFAVLSLEVFIQIYMLSASLVLAVFFFSKKRIFPKIFIAYVASLFGLGILSAGLIASAPNAAPQVVGQAIAFPVYVFLCGAIWIPYFLKSKRVNATFTIGLSNTSKCAES